MGERLLGSLIDRAHILPARLLGPLIAQEVAAVNGQQVTIYLQDFEQMSLRPLSGEGLTDSGVVPVDASLPGRAFMLDQVVEQPQPDGGVRLFLPMLDGSDRVGVLAFTLPQADDNDRRLARRLAGLVADMIVTKGMYTDTFFETRATRPMSLSAQIQRQLLPPLTMTTPQVALAGVLEPAYDVGGDSFDFALNGHILHLGIIDAMGHELDAAVMATVAIAAYRHSRRTGVGLADLYSRMDRAMSAQFGPERFATAQMGELDARTGLLRWVNAGHPPPLLLRGRRVVRELAGSTTLPVGFGGASPVVQSLQLEPGDRVLLFTDGVIEERMPDGQQFGSPRFVDLVERAGADGGSVQEMVRRLSGALMSGRAGRTSDDATLLLVEWIGGDAEDELKREIELDLSE
jgi:serine phosphatase RsbU (regulator of sigma subunit)